MYIWVRRTPAVGVARNNSDPTMIPNGKLLALVLAFAAVGGLVATGAFTSVSADRTAEVDTAGDDAALLALEAGPGSSGIVQQDGGTINLALDNNAASGNGVNVNATTTFDGVLNVTNQGADSTNLDVSLTSNSDGISDADVDSAITFETSDAYSDVSSDGVSSGVDLTSTSVSLAPGDTVVIDFEIDTTTISPGTGASILDQITFTADSS